MKFVAGKNKYRLASFKTWVIYLYSVFIAHPFGIHLFAVPSAMTSLGDDTFGDGYSANGGSQGSYRYVSAPSSGHHTMSHSKHQHGGASAMSSSSMREQSESSSFRDQVENEIESDVLEYEEEAHMAEAQLNLHDPRADRPTSYTATLNVDLDFDFKRGSGSAHAHISQDELRDLIESTMTKTGATWVKMFPRHLLEHAFVDQHEVTLYSLPYRSSSHNHSLLLVSNIPSLNNRRYYSSNWRHGSGERAVDTVLLHSGFEAKTHQRSEAETYFHLDPVHWKHAAHGHESSVFYVKSVNPSTGDFYIFRKNSIYDTALSEIIVAMKEDNPARPTLENFYNESAQRDMVKLLVLTKEIKHLDLNDFRIVARAAVDKWVRPKVFLKLKGQPLSMFSEGLSFHLTTDLSSVAAIEHLTGRTRQTEALTASPIDHRATMHLSLTLVFPLPFPSHGEPQADQ